MQKIVQQYYFDAIAEQLIKNFLKRNRLLFDVTVSQLPDKISPFLLFGKKNVVYQRGIEYI